MTTATDTPAVTRHNTVLAGHRTLGEILLRTDADVCVWRIGIEHAKPGVPVVSGQLTTVGDDDQKRRDIRRVAELLGLAYSESAPVSTPGYVYTAVSAAGVFDGSDVDIWAHVDRTNYAPELAGTAVSS